MSQDLTNDQKVINVQSFLSEEDNTAIALILVEKACEQYQRLYKKLNVPFSYINFFSEEFFKYSGLFQDKLKSFYTAYTSLAISADDLIDRYISSYYSQHKSIKATKHEKYLVFDDFIPPSFTNEMRAVTSTPVSSLVENIIAITIKMENQDELVDLIDLYEQFMITDFIMNHEIKKKTKPASKKANVEKIVPAVPEKLVGTVLDDNYQKSGKITKIIIPKLSLPTTYPTSAENSRINANHKAKFICTPAKQIIFINKKKIVAVKYTQKFLDKRSNKKPKKKFDWDF